MSSGAYVHIPFCAARCDYCDFATWTDRALYAAKAAGRNRVCIAPAEVATPAPVLV